MLSCANPQSHRSTGNALAAIRWQQACPKKQATKRIVGIMLGGILIVVGSFMALLFDFVAQQQ